MSKSDQALIESYFETPELKKGMSELFGYDYEYTFDWGLNCIFIQGSKDSTTLVLSEVLKLIKSAPKGH